MGGALGLAMLSTIAASQTHAQIGVSAARALTDGFDLAFTVAAGFALVGAVVAAVALRPAARVRRRRGARPSRRRPMSAHAVARLTADRQLT